MASPQATRHIPIMPKITAAKTQYYEIDADDEAYIYQWLTRFLADTAEMATFDADLQRDLFRRRPDTLPRGRNGPNSIASFVGGIVAARLVNPQHNLSESLLDPLENIFDMIANMYDQEAAAPDAIRFKRKLF